MARYKVVHTDTDKYNVTVEREILAPLDVDLVEAALSTEKAVIDACYDADAILNVRAPMHGSVIESLEQCKLIARYGIGVDNVDMEACTRKGIWVMNVPDVCVEEVADHCLALALSFWRKVVKGNEMCKSGLYDRMALKPIRRIRGATWGLVGFGKIARLVCSRAATLGMRVLAFDPYISESSIREFGATPADLQELLRESDVISLHTPLTNETLHILSEPQFQLMKPTAYLINVARGKCVDGIALHRALVEGWIAGAGLDVMEQEPPAPNDPLLQLSNVLLTPHMAGYSEESFDDTRERCAEGVVKALEGQMPQGVLNPDARST